MMKRLQLGSRRANALVLAVSTMLVTTISAGQADEPFQLDPAQVEKHFTELTMGSHDSTPRYLRWSTGELHMAFLAPEKSQLLRSASTGIGLVANLFSDAIPIEQTKNADAGSPQADAAKKAELLFIVASTRAEIDALMPDLTDPDQGLTGLAWLSDPSAFGPGCGAMVGYVADGMTIKKAILTIEGQALLGADAATTDRKLINGYAFNCTNRQLAAALGLVKDWGHGVSAPGYSTFVSSHNAPFYDWAALEILYLKEFSEPISAAQAKQSVAANAACLAQNHQVCTPD